MSELAERIEAAFGNVVLGTGTSLHQAQALDRMDLPAVVEQARRRDTEHRWQEIADEKVEDFHYALTYLNPEGLRFYLPRYMIFSLEHPGLDSPAVDAAVYACDFGDDTENIQQEVLAQFNAMSRRQMTVIAEFLAFVAQSEDANYDTLVAAIAVDNFWWQFLEPEGAGPPAGTEA